MSEPAHSIAGSDREEQASRHSATGESSAPAAALIPSQDVEQQVYDEVTTRLQTSSISEGHSLDDAGPSGVPSLAVRVSSANEAGVADEADSRSTEEAQLGGSSTSRLQAATKNSASGMSGVEGDPEASLSATRIGTSGIGTSSFRPDALSTPTSASPASAPAPAPVPDDASDRHSEMFRPPPMPKTVVDADPADVAAVAAAFGRGSPAQPSPRSSSVPKQADHQTASSSYHKSLPKQPPSTTTNLPSAPTPTTPATGGIRVGKGPPPDSPPPAELQFDFNRFLEQMRYKAAAPIGEYVRSFIKGFSKKPYRISDQSKLIFDFLDFISGKMRSCDVWSKASEAEFANAEEAMEKLVMNRLYIYTFAPAVQREGRWPVQTDDLERDRILSERIAMFGWIREEHLDVPKGDHSKGFIEFAIQELLKINHYKAPRDKLICILNSCKVIFGLIRHLSSEENADTFIPVLIYVVLRSNPEHLISNVEYIGRFRTPERLSSESGYYLSSLMGAIAFIETMDYTSLSNITQEEFESKVETAVQSLERPQPRASPSHFNPPPGREAKSPSDPTAAATSGEEAAKALPFTPMSSNLATDTRAFFQRTSEAARMGINTSLGKPIGALGRLLNEGLDGIRTPGSGDGSPSRNESPTPASSQGQGSVRGLFGFFDRDDSNVAQQQQARSSGFNAASWSRGLKGSDPPDDDLNSPTRSSFRKTSAVPQTPPGQTPLRPQPLRVDSINLESSDGPPSAQVGTPSDDGSAEGFDGTQGPTAFSRQQRGRLPQFGDYVPDFLSERVTPARPAEQSVPAAPSQQPPAMLRRAQFGAPSSDGHEFERSSSPTPAGMLPSSDDVSAAELSAEVDRAHAMRLEAGVDTLRNIFPNAEHDVCLMVLESCNGDVQASIDKLLDMS